jgi:hypothetical protein
MRPRDWRDWADMAALLAYVAAIVWVGVLILTESHW